MNITIVSVGKIKEKYFKDAIDEYKKRLSPFTKLKITEVSDEKAPENLSEAEIEIVKDKEGERILKKINDTDFVISLEIEGKSISSEKFSNMIKDEMNFGGGRELIFVIGGSNGLSKKISDRANYKLSFSKMTLPHKLMRLVLIEQIYRAFKIINNQPYHK
ncbi:23S rRNA (pseudouridine(1915)-N(3))-methyltransferase RlmH [Anaerococcus sp. AGMB00486]|uniref:Ribosomal RNA large subunit methyltransferase H n=2 Tax=Anaerococcus TaxID=165779 RepID=A0ABX2N856_9FIRM|nr:MULTISPECIES: 23S rRNA (pseudouridine(1915)-N(3))-methyltransferase RlmH [Anaerococcus]MDY3005427.1 23S rRNA (pseudouridine(1915)-N(3))-methyltransferase RlmH [Anaerococcus porci]MSS77334.1 23S rRNA (pseudouridine(1915)-N(3))-methyltransferase RlmH [Anaerococcus porci]NVF10864.1 23S rRNA (pseudouridine(1915)-N(3))-methyltransferase RlmH [Anaerococcus faecalis]